VRLIGEEGEQLGILPLRDALRMAQDRGYDLVEVAAAAKPPVCRIMDYGKFKYEEQKRDREARKKQKIMDIKEVKMRPTIDEHDFDVKAKGAVKFLQEGDKVKATIMFRGREVVHAERGKMVLDRLAEFIGDVGVIERPARLEGRNMIMIVSPKQQQ